MNHSPLWTPERQLAQTGLGELRRFELYPGMELAMTSFHGERVQLEHEPLADVLEINYCRKGRIGWSMRDGMSVYLGPGDLELHTMDRCAVSAITLPLGYYEGITLTLDAGRLERDGLWFFRESGIGCPALAQKLCPGGRPLALPANTELARIFDPLYTVSERLWRTCCKLKALELLLYLDEFVSERERQLGQYRSSQVDTIKEIHALLTADLRQRHTIEELSRAYLINTATLKSVFKAVYSQPIGAYMKEYRLRRAMELLRESDESIAEIAAQVGYECQGNFTEAFKALTQMSPTEYRRKQRSS